MDGRPGALECVGPRRVRRFELEREVVRKRDLEQNRARAFRVPEAVEERQRASVMPVGLLFRIDGLRRIARFEEITRGALGLVGLGEMVCEQPVCLRELVRAQLLERGADDAVEVSAAPVEQARVRRFAHEAVTEAVLRRRPAPLLDDEVEPLQLGQRGTQLLRRDEPLEQRLTEAATDDGRDRRHLAHVGCEPVEPRLERLLDCGGHGGSVAALDRVPRRLLEEERVAAGALGEARGDVLGKLAAGRGGCELLRRRRVERLEQELAEPVAVASSRRLAELPRAEVGVVAICQQERHRLLVGELEQLFEELERRLVGEVQVFEDEAHRLLARERADELDHGLVRLALNGIACEPLEPLRRLVLELEPEQRREKGVVDVERAGELHLQLEPYARLRIGHAEAQARTKQLAQRVVRNVLRVRDALRGEEARALPGAAANLRDEAALADARLARDRDDRAAAVDQAGHHVVENAAARGRGRPGARARGARAPARPRRGRPRSPPTCP